MHLAERALALTAQLRPSSQLQWQLSGKERLVISTFPEAKGSVRRMPRRQNGTLRATRVQGRFKKNNNYVYYFFESLSH